MSNIVILSVQGQLRERGGCTLCPFESCLAKAYAPPVVAEKGAEERAHCTLAPQTTPAPPQSSPQPHLPGQSPRKSDHMSVEFIRALSKMVLGYPMAGIL